MPQDEWMPISMVVLDCRDPAALAGFYLKLLGWQLADEEPGGGWVDIACPGGGAKLAFQRDEDYAPPQWPAPPPAPQQMMHLDFEVPDAAALHKAVEHALRYGAKKAPVQFDETHWVTLLDPAGHPFCFVVTPVAATK